jgi:hypothetical protein
MGVDLEALQDRQDVIGDLAAFALADLAAGPVDELEVGGLGETFQGESGPFRETSQLARSTDLRAEVRSAS